MRFTSNLNLINKTQFVRLIGLIMQVSGLTMLLPVAAAIYYGDQAQLLNFGLLAAALMILGTAIRKVFKSKPSRIRARDGFLFVIASMLLAILIGALPFYMSGQGYSFLDSWFESASGWTTTGARLIDPLSMSEPLLLWKSELNFMGGFVMIFLTVSIFQKLGIGGQKSVAHDLPGANFEKLTVKMSDAALILIKLYVILTVLEIALLVLSGMRPLYAVVNSLSTMSTSGILVVRDVMNGFIMTPLMKAIIISFTILASLNFVFYFLLYTREFKLAFRNYEIRLYGIMLFVAGSIIATSLILSETYKTPIESLYNGFVQTISFSSTSGFMMSNVQRWPTIAKVILLFLPIIGGCGFSTSSGLKVHRVAILYRIVTRGIYKRIHPKSMKPVVINGKAVAAERAASITVFGLLYFAVIVVAGVIFSLDNQGIELSLQAAVSCITNNGTGVGTLVNGDYTIFSPFIRFFATIVMISGRLELYAIFVLLSRTFWDTNRAT